MPKKRRHVDPMRVHLITLVIFGVIAGAALTLWTFPRFFGALALLIVSGVVYARLYGFIEQRLEAEEGRLAEELGFDLGDDEDEDEPAPKPRRKKKKRAAAVSGNGAPSSSVEAPAVTTPEPPVVS